MRRDLESEFERLRGELGTALERYEGRLAAICDETPDWLEVEASEIRGLFALEDESLEEPARLGPRLGAVLAGRVEAFFEEWVSELDAPESIDEDRASALAAEARELDETLDRLAERIAEVVDERESSLQELEERGAETLEEKRQQDIDALEDLVDEGEVQTGPDAREERARLWEEQRRRSDALDETIDGIEWLLEIGAETSRAWIGELRNLLEEALRGFVRLEPGLEQAEEWPDELVARARDRATSPGERAGEQQGRGATTRTTGRAADAETAPSPGPPVEMSDEEEASGPFLRKPPESDSASRPSRSNHPREGSGEAQEVAPTEPLDGSGPGVDTDVPATESEDVLEGGASGDGDDLSDDSDGPGEAPSGTERDSAVRSDSTEPTVSEERSTGSGEEPTSAGEAASTSATDDEVTIETSCLRIESSWHRVETPTVLAAIGPPAAVIAAFLSMGSAHLFDLDGSINPIAVWPWVEHAVIVAFGWLVAAPLILGWRPRWEGWHFEFVAERETRDEKDLSLEEEALVIGSIRLPWDAIQRAERMRWEASDDSMRGWVLELEPTRFENVTFIASAGAGRRWSAADGPVIEPPLEAWQVDESTLEAIEGRIEG